VAWEVQGRSLGAHAHSLAPLWAPLDTYAAAPGARPAHLRGSEPASPFLAKPIQNEFCGIGKSTQEPAGPRRPLRAGRWVYEKREGIAAGEEAEGSSEHSACTAPSRPRSAHLWHSSRAWLRAFARFRAREPIFSKTHTKRVLRDWEIHPRARRAARATARRSVGI
jgi:hypothetical protein